MNKQSLLTLAACFAVLLTAGLSKAVAQAFNHPGILHTQADFDRMSQMVNANQQPYLDGWNMLVNSTYSQSGWQHRATATIVRGGSGDNVALLYNDVARAYQNALRWKISGSTAHGDTARDILNGWSATLTTVTGNADRYLAAGLFGYQLANASEMMRGYPGFNVSQMQDMLYNVFYKPLNERFLVGNEFGADHNDACITNYWANWDLCNMAAVVAIGIFCDNRDIYNQGIEYFKNGAGNGSIYNAVPFLHPNGLAQWQESGRDQGHTILGIGLMASLCEMAWNQGDDMYGWADNRFMKAAEYVARYNNGHSVPFTTYSWGSGQNCAYNEHTAISSAGRDEYRPVWEMIYNHYANRRGLSVPNIAARAASQRPEGGPGGHATTFDQPGFGTLTYTRPASGGAIPDGTYRIIARHSGKALDVASFSTADGGNIQQWSSTGGTNQQWDVTHLGGGEYRILSAHSGKALDVAGISTADGANIHQWTYLGGDNQKWTLADVGGGFHSIRAVHSGKALDVDGISSADGANVHQWSYLGGQNQQWRFEPVNVVARLQSHNFPARHLRHSNYRARIDENISPADDARFHIVSGLADPAGVSFEAVNFPGYFLHVRSNGEVWLDQDDGTTAFDDNATFRRVPGLADSAKSSYQMWTDSSRYLRHSNYLMYSQSGSGSLFDADATFGEVAP